MSVPLWVSELAGAFWAKTQDVEPFPRNLRRPIARAVRLAVVLLPKLSVRAAMDWLQNCGMVCEFPGVDRPLRACLVARRGHGVALIDGTDGDAEQRFSIAHELAHFLRDYWSVRRRISKRLGAGVLEVLDGERPPTTQERMHALLRNEALGFHLHLMERDLDGNPATQAIAKSEDDADRLAYELLAPAEHVLADGASSNTHALVERLQRHYGLPGPQAVRYAGILRPRKQTDPLLLRFRAAQ